MTIFRPSRRNALIGGAAAAGTLALRPLLQEAGLMAAEDDVVAQPTASAARRGVDPQKVFQRALDEALDNGELGLQIAVYKDGKEVVNVWGGHLDEAKSRKIAPNSLFNTFSVCKAWTNTCLHLQAERGLVDYNKPVSHYWPEFAQNGKEKTTVRHILSHQGGLPLMPEGVTPEKMADFDWMVQQLAAMKPLYEAGTKNGYHSYTQGWLVAEIVRRTDPAKRDFNRFLQEEICQPLGIKDMWLGVPASAEPRVSTLYGKGGSAGSDNEMMVKSMPVAVETSPAVWGKSVVRRSCIPGAGGITCAGDHVKFWAMLAGGGQLNGVRLLSPERVRSFSYPRPSNPEPDFVLGRPLAISTLGYWLRGSGSAVGSGPHMICQTGAGNNIGWADPDLNLAVTIAHNRFGGAYSEPLSNAVQRAFGAV